MPTLECSPERTCIAEEQPLRDLGDRQAVVGEEAGRRFSSCFLLEA